MLLVLLECGSWLGGGAFFFFIFCECREGGRGSFKKVEVEGSWGQIFFFFSFQAETETAAEDAVAVAAAFCTLRSFAAVRRILAAAIAAPNPLSMLQTVTPGLEETSAESSGVIPCSEAP